MKPPQTTLEDILWLIGLFFVAAIIIHVIRLIFGFERESLRIMERAKKVIPSAVIDHALVVQAARRFHLTFIAFWVSYLPMLVLAIGGSACTLLRDDGYLIFPWLIPSVLVIFSFTNWLSMDWRERAILESALELHFHQAEPEPDFAPLPTSK